MLSQYRLIKYKFQPRPKDPGRRVESGVTLLGLFGPTEDFTRICYLSAQLQKVWRRRVFRLVATGWKTDVPRIFEKRAHVLLNCRPCGCFTTPRSLKCCLFFCPQCWARRASVHWQTINNNLFADKVLPDALPTCGRGKVFAPKPPAKARATYDILQVERLFDVPMVATEKRKQVPGLTQFLTRRNQSKPRGGWKKAHRWARGHESKLNCAGMFEMITPIWRPSSPDRWTIRVRQLFAVPPSELLGLQPLPDAPMRYKRLERPTRAAVLRAAIWTMKYPRWLLYGPEARLLQFVEERQKTRLVSTTGIFRGKFKAERLDEVT